MTAEVKKMQTLVEIFEKLEDIVALFAPFCAWGWLYYRWQYSAVRKALISLDASDVSWQNGTPRYLTGCGIRLSMYAVFRT